MHHAPDARGPVASRPAHPDRKKWTGIRIIDTYPGRSERNAAINPERRVVPNATTEAGGSLQSLHGSGRNRTPDPPTPSRPILAAGLPAHGLLLSRRL